MSVLTSQQYWNSIGSQKEFEDPLYLEKLSPFINPESKIIEYGCGYGRLMQILMERGYTYLRGFDFSQNMIERGKQLHPHLNLHLLQESGQIPCETESVDAVIMSTVLCSMIDPDEQSGLLEEIWRILKNKGVLYISDFLICENVRYREKYVEGFKRFGRWGLYTTTENLLVCHLTTSRVFELLKSFDVQWFEQFDFKTMNNNPARTFHSIGIKN